MLSQQRQQQILEFIKSHKSAQITELSDTFGISQSTIRRDLREMEDNGVINRVHGGAVLVENQFEASVRQRSHEHSQEKHRIGQAAAELVQDGETIIITSGSTTGAMLPFLADKQNLTIITNAITIAYDLGQYPDIEVIVLGGWMRRSEYSLLGHIAMQALQDLQASKIFHGVYGIDAEIGLTGTFLPEVQTDRALFAAARELIILADSSKFDNVGPVRLAPVDDVSMLITDENIPIQQIEALERKGVQVIQT